MTRMIRFFKKLSQHGQGETEYILILALVGAVVVAGLLALGPKIGDIFFNVSDSMADQQQTANSGGAADNQPGGDHAGSPGDNTVPPTPPTATPTPIPSKVSITKVDYKKEDHKVELEATFDGGADPNITLTVSPTDAVMKYKKDHYKTKIAVYGCPCDITVTANNGDIDTVTIGAENDGGDDDSGDDGGKHEDDSGGKKDDGGGKKND